MTAAPFRALTAGQHDDALALVRRISGLALLIEDAADHMAGKPEGAAYSVGAEMIRTAAEALADIIRKPEADASSIG